MEELRAGAERMRERKTRVEPGRYAMRITRRQHGREAPYLKTDGRRSLTLSPTKESVLTEE